MFEIISEVITFQNILMMNIGLFAGIIIGAMPGLSVAFAVTVLLTMTLGMGSLPGMFMLLGGYCGATFGGSITAILINTPGTPVAAATAIDGHAMARKGRAGDALNLALWGSTFGGLFSAFALMFLAPQLAKIVNFIASPEMFAICLFGLCATITLSKDNVLKGIIAALIGLFLRTVGLDPINGTARMIFGSSHLMAGIKAVTCMLGVYALAQVLHECNTARKMGDSTAEAVKYSKSTLKIFNIFKYWKHLIKSSIIGVVIGAIPGTGGAVSAIFSYNEARRTSDNPDEFGEGAELGILAPETGNNAVTGATMIPMLTMGIPGDAVMAILLGALTMQGVVPGPELFSKGSIWVYAIMGGLFLINIFMLIQGSLFIKAFVNVTKVPENLLLPCVVVLCCMGAFAISNNIFEVYVLAILAMVGFLMKKFELPVIPFTIALVLGDLCETNLRRSLMVSYGKWSIFVTRPICLCVLLVCVALLLYPSVSKFIKNRKAARSGAEK